MHNVGQDIQMVFPAATDSGAVTAQIFRQVVPAFFFGAISNAALRIRENTAFQPALCGDFSPVPLR